MKSTIKEIADELRANSELDEEKLRMLEKEQRKIGWILYSLAIVPLFGAVIEMSLTSIIFAGVLAYYFIFVMLRKGTKEFVILTHLFSNGIKHKGILHNLVPHTGLVHKIDIECSTNVGNKNFRDNFIASHKFLKAKDYPKIGDEIEIIYDKNNPSLFRFYNKEYANHFCIRKHKGDKL